MAKIYPVIHFFSLALALKNAELALKNKCEGVFLIHMQGFDTLLSGAFKDMKRHFPDLKIGINRLNSEPVAAMMENLSINADATWVDNCGISSKEPTVEAMRLRIKRPKAHPLFGSVAFKYQPEDLHPDKAALLAYQYGFIPVTSGEATGSVPDLAKIEKIASVLPSKTLGVASGINSTNVRVYLPYVEHILVATGISKSYYEFDPDRLKRLVDIVHSH